MKSFKELQEVLTKSDPIEKWISDFVHSDNPKFAGKSKEERIKMAQGAYYGAQKEDISIDEATVDTADIEKNKNIKQSDKDKLGNLSSLMAKQKKPIKERTEHNEPVRLTSKDSNGNVHHLSSWSNGHVELRNDNSKLSLSNIMHKATHLNGDKEKESHLKKVLHSAHIDGKDAVKDAAEKATGMKWQHKSIKEESGEHHDYEHVKKTMKKVDFDTYSKHMNKHDADHSMENKHKVDTQHSGSYTGKIHGAEVSHKVSGSGQKEYYIKEEAVEESRGHKILATAMANAERMKTVQIPTPAERRAELEKQNKEKQMKEAAEKKPYIVISHVSDNTGTRAGGEKVEKNRVATKLIATSPEHALQLSKAHHEKSGRKVHSASIKEDISVDEAVDHQHKIARDTVKNPNKSLLGGPSAKEAEETLRKKYGYDDKKIAKLKEAVDTVKKDASGKVIAWSHEGDWEKMSTKKQGTGKAANLAGKALQKTKELNKEEVDLDEDAVSDYRDKKRSEREAEHAKQDPKHSVRYAKNMVDVDKAAKKAKERGIKVDPMDFHWKVRNGVQRGKLPEEVELEESWEVYDTKTRAIHSKHPTQRKALNAMNKLNDKHPGYETPGDLIASKFGARVSKEVKEEVELDEAAWGKDKVANLRQAHDRHMEKALAANKAGDDEAVKVHQRKMQMIQGKLQKLKNNEEVELGEECEILSELDKKTLGSYVNKAHDQLMKHTASVNMKYGRGDKDATAYALDKEALRKTANRTQGVKTALNKLTKEDTMVTYSEFMSSIEEGRIDDLKDKLAADREKRLNRYDFSKEKEAKKSNVTVVKAKNSYGAGDEEDEAGEKAKPAEPAQKRGRGRPAGSKSGVTKYN